MSSSQDHNLPEVEIGQKQKRQFGKLAGRVKSVTEFITDAVDAALPFHEALQKSAPWAEWLIGAAGEVVPPIKFLAKLCENIGQIDDPEELGNIACTLAFESAVTSVLHTVSGPVEEKYAIKEVKEQLSILEPIDEVDFSTFTFEIALDHEFYKRAEIQLQTALIVIGYGKGEVNRITNLVKDNFVTFLKELLVRRETAQRFLPFKEYLELGGAVERASYRALAEHAKFQRWLFEEAAVLGRSPFALQHVYVETDCAKFAFREINPNEGQFKLGSVSALARRKRSKEELFPRDEVYTWDPEAQAEAFDEKMHDMRQAEQELDDNSRPFAQAKIQKVDPFSESFGAREPLLRTVMEIIGDWRIPEPIIVQGVAGAGKSTFTLRLCIELQRHHLRPVLIRFKDLRFDKHVSEALPQAVRLSNDQRSPDFVPPTPVDLFRDGNIFRERGAGKYTRISRYVLILDGWDEVSIANEGFRHRIETILGQLRSEYISNPTLSVPVRIVMTGRPSTDLNESGFLRESTPILTIRPFTPEQLAEYFNRLAGAVRDRPLDTTQVDRWPEFDASKFRPVVKRYEAEFGKLPASFTRTNSSLPEREIPQSSSRLCRRN